MKNKISLTLFFLLSWGSLFAGVNPKNGNFYVSYTDIVFKNGSMGLEISRTYNSIVANKGWFGIGWGSDYETFLITLPGGGIMIFNNGTGKRDVQQPQSWNTSDISAGVDEIVEAMRSEDLLKTPDDVIVMKDKLINNAELRATYWRKYLEKGKVRNRTIATGSKLYSTCGCMGFQYMEVTGDGFKRSNGDGRTEYFDLNGRFIKIENDKGGFIHMEYDDAGRIRKIEDDAGNILLFVVNDKKLVERITDPALNRSSEYRYDDAGNLVYSRDIASNIYQHTYDAKSNMTRILYVDGSSVDLEYNNQSRLTRIRFRDGKSETYEYPEKSALEYGSAITYRDSSGNITSRFFEWYVYRRDNFGNMWASRILRIVDDTDTTLMTYNEKHQKIDTLILSGERWVYSYDVKGALITVKEAHGFSISLQYEGVLFSGISCNTSVFRFGLGKDNQITKITSDAGGEWPCPLVKGYENQSPEGALLYKCFTILDYSHLKDQLPRN